LASRRRCVFFKFCKFSKTVKFVETTFLTSSRFLCIVMLTLFSFQTPLFRLFTPVFHTPCLYPPSDIWQGSSYEICLIYLNMFYGNVSINHRTDMNLEDKKEYTYKLANSIFVVQIQFLTTTTIVRYQFSLFD